MTGDVVYIGCKTPNGLVLHLRQNRVERANGQVIVTSEGEDLGEVTLKGTAVPFGKPPIDIDGYVFTRVPKDFWEAWLKLNAASSLLKDGFIKPAASLEAGKKIAREHEAAPGQFAPIPPATKDAPKDPADAFRSQAERVSRGAGLGVKKFVNEEAA